MSMKQPGQKTYRTMQGKQIDMEMLRKKNELTPAVGNAKVNARGDELGPGGKIVRKREDIVNDYYKSTRSVPDEPGVPKKDAKKETEKQPAEEQKTEAKTTKKRTSRKKDAETAEKPKAQEPTAEEAAEWEEDENGDFVRKGE